MPSRLATPSKALPPLRSGYAYRVTWRDDGCECDEGWTWDDAAPWSRAEAIAYGIVEVAETVPSGDDYVLHVAMFEYGWPVDLEPIDIDVLLDEAERIVTEPDDTMIDDSRGLWTDLPEGAVEELENDLANAWHTWCRKHQSSIGAVRMLGKPEIVDCRGSWTEEP